MDSALFTEIGVNEVIAPATESVAEVGGVASTSACVEHRPKGVEETSLLLRAL